MEPLRVAGVLPRLVLESAHSPPLVLDEPVAVAVAVLVDPSQRRERRPAQLVDESRVVRPPPDLGEQHEEQRRRVDGAVVAVEPVRRGLAAPHLVDDLARLGVPRRVVGDRLQRRELAERAARELGPEQQRLQRRDQRVAPEHRHEPRHAGGRQLPRAAALAGLHLQRRQVVHRLSEGVPELVPRRLHPRHVHLPCVERLAHARTLLAEVTVDAARRTRRPPGAAGDHVDTQLPPLPRLQLHVVGDAARRRRPALGQDHLRAAEAVTVGEEVLVAVAVELRLDRLRQRLRVRRVAEREVPFLHREDVREVGAELDADGQLERRHRLVLQHEVVLHAVADETLAADGDRVERQRVRQRVAQEERGGEVLDGAGREEQRPLAVDRQARAARGSACRRRTARASSRGRRRARREMQNVAPSRIVSCGTTDERCVRRRTGCAPSRRSRPRSRATGG